MKLRIVVMAAVAVAGVPVAAQQEPASAAARAAAQTRLLALYLDTGAMSKDDLARAVSTAKRLLQAPRVEGQQVAILTNNGRAVAVQQDYTADVEQLNKALDRIGASPESATPTGESGAALQNALRLLGALPGKKGLVWLGGTMASGAEPPEAAVKAATEANVAVYSIDIRGSK